jgi:selenocysteine lyase/cysteine desulfurase
MQSNSKITYLNTAACGLIEEEVKAAGFDLYNAVSKSGSAAAEDWRFNKEAGIRKTIAGFIGAPATNVAMIPNFSWALNGLVQSLKGTEKVLLYKHDYPSVVEPFRINNFDITWVDAKDGFTLPVDEIETAVKNNKIDIVVLSHVQFSTGYKLDIVALGALCKEHSVLFIVDATQSIGAVPIDLSKQHADVLIASNYKWMNAGFGTGIMYISDSFLDKYPPVVGGHNSYQMVEDKMQYVPSALSYEPGHPNMLGHTIVAAAIEHKMKMGLDKIVAHNMQLTQLLIDNIGHLSTQLIGPLNIDNRTSIVILKDENGISEKIKKHNIIVTNRNNTVRISMHYYNTEADVMRLVDALR